MATVAVLATATFQRWLAAQNEQIRDQVAQVVGVLAVKGLELGFPYSSQIEGKIRELRPAGGASPARVFYAFDVLRSAVLLCGGVKTGHDLYEDGLRQAKAELAAHEAAIQAREERASKAAKAKPKKQKKRR